MEPLLGKVDSPAKEKGTYDDLLSFEFEGNSGDNSVGNDKLNDETKGQINLLINMGFDEKMIRKLYLFLTPHSIEEAANMLIKENGIYHHPFYRRESRNSLGNPDLCFICGEEEKNHDNTLVTQIRTSSFPAQRNTRKSGKDESLCTICLCTFDKNELGGYKLKCNHLFCPSCWEEFIREKITIGDYSQLKCMEQDCRNELPEEFVKFFIKNDKELFQKYKTLKQKDKILKSKDLKFCPEPDCDGYLKKGKDKFTQCQKGHKYCYECCKPWHKGRECESIAELDKKFYEWKAGKRVKPCPNCKMFTEKNEGCNHMTCAECHFQWCWLCEKKYTSNHYKTGDCAGQQFVVAEKPNPKYSQERERDSDSYRYSDLTEDNFWGRNPPPLCLRIIYSYLLLLVGIIISCSLMFSCLYGVGLFVVEWGSEVNDNDGYMNFEIVHIFAILMIIMLVIPYQVTVTCISAVLVLPSIFYYGYTKKLIVLLIGGYNFLREIF